MNLTFLVTKVSPLRGLSWLKRIPLQANILYASRKLMTDLERVERNVTGNIILYFSSLQQVGKPIQMIQWTCGDGMVEYYEQINGSYLITGIGLPCELRSSYFVLMAPAPAWFSGNWLTSTNRTNIGAPPIDLLVSPQVKILTSMQTAWPPRTATSGRRESSLSGEPLALCQRALTWTPGRTSPRTRARTSWLRLKVWEDIVDLGGSDPVIVGILELQIVYYD